jgi:malonyl-CoA O-methyltransferase
VFHRLRQAYHSIRRPPVDELDPLEAYQLWADTYDDAEHNALLYADVRAVHPLIARHRLSGKAVLDAGCGTGRNLEALGHDKPRLVAAVDFSQKMIEGIGSKAGNSPSITVQIARLESLPYKDAQFDFALCTLVLDHVADLRRGVSELSRVLRPGGAMVISSFHPFGKLLGWQRSFRAHLSNGRRQWFAPTYVYHSHADYYGVFQSVGLDVVAMLEPRIDETLKSFYARAGRDDLFSRYYGYPLLLVFELHKR